MREISFWTLDRVDNYDQLKLIEVICFRRDSNHQI